MGHKFFCGLSEQQGIFIGSGADELPSFDAYTLKISICSYEAHYMYRRARHLMGGSLLLVGSP